MAVPEKEPHIVTTDPDEAREIFDALYVMGILDDGDIYEIKRPDGTVERLQLGGSLRHAAGRIIQQAYSDCEVTLLSSGEQATSAQ